MKFFDFSNIENLQSRICLKQNIIQLLDEQLKLSSGQSLWEAFLYLHETCKEKFTFKFAFEVNSSFGASIGLDKCEKDPNSQKKLFYFKVRCNEMFSKSVFSLKANMLYRPCLIKLNGKYHLREQKLPFFITLAHEFLHALNQLERIQEIIINKEKEISLASENLNNEIDNILTIQEFLMKKLNITEDSLCMKK